MSDPLLALQGAIVARLKADAPTVAFVAQRIYDEVPTSATFPYISLGDGQSNGDDIDCAKISEVYFQIHAWSRSPDPGYVKVKGIAAAVRDAMTAPIVMPGFEVQEQQYQQTQLLRDPDGLTRHAMVEFRFIIVH